MKKIAFCFLIYDIINHENLWHLFFKDIDKNKYNIYIHYKNNKPLKFFEQFKLEKCIKTEYSDISLVYAQNLLLKKAVADNNTHYIFISNSCIPIKSFNYVYNFLNEQYSYFNITKQSQCFPRCNNTLKFIDKKFIQKASQWCILNKKHASLIISNFEYLKWFNYKGTVPDEHCYITFIFFNNLQHEIITTPNIPDGATTFTNWEGMDYKYPSLSELKNYDNIDDEELKYLLDSKSLFARKFTTNCDLNFEYYLNFIKN